MDEMTSLEVRKLEEAVESGRKVKIYIVNGRQFEAVIQDFDCNVLIVDVQGREQMVYRHAVSTIDYGTR